MCAKFIITLGINTLHLRLFTSDACSLVSKSVVIAVGIEKRKLLKMEKIISSPDKTFIASKGENSDFLS